MAYVNLREYIEVLEAGKRPKGGAVNEGVPSLGGEHITNTGKFNLSNDKLKYVPREYYDELKKGKIKINDVIVVKDGATTGKTAIVEDDFLLKEACINEHVFLLRTKDSLNPKYLFYYFLSEQGQQEILKDFRGATVGGISKDFIDMDIYISDLDTQKKIVEVLDKAQELIDKRKEQIEVLDELVQSRFNELFNNYFCEEYMNNLMTISHKITDGEHGTVPRVEKGIPYLMARNININNQLDFKEVSYIEEKVHEKIYSRCNPEYDDLLIVCVGATIGKVALVPKMEQFSLARSVALVKYQREKINGKYLLWLFNHNYMKIQFKISNGN